MDLNLKGLTALVSGGTSGIGAAVVRRFASEGANVAFCSRSPEKVDSMRRGVQAFNDIEVYAAAVDVREAARFSDWVSSIPAIDIFVANVSAMSQDWVECFETDIQATLAAVDAVLPSLLASKFGAITYIGSKVSTYGNTRWPVYSAAKACMVHYMKSLSLQVASKGIRVNTVSPGDIYFTGGVWESIKKDQPSLYAATVAQCPMGRLGTPEEVADTVVFVSSPLASFITGSHLLVDGGGTSQYR